MNNSNTSTLNVNTENSNPYEFIYHAPESVAFDTSLTINDLRIYMIICSFMYTKRNTYASNNWISKKLNVDRSTVIRSINRLCEKKYVVRQEIKGQRYLVIAINPMPEGVAAVPPPRRSHATPPSQPCDPINTKIINTKNIKTTTTKKTEKSKSSSSDFVISKKIDEELLKDRNKHIQDDDLNRTPEEFLRQCSHHLDNGDKNKYNLARRLAGLKTIIKSGFFEKPAGYDEKKVVKSLHTPEESALLYKYEHALQMVALGAKLEVYMPDPQELKRAMQLKEKSENKPSLSKRFGRIIGFDSK